MDKLNAAWSAFRTATNAVLPSATGSLHQMHTRIADLPGNLPPPGGGPGGGGNNGGGDTPGNNPAIEAVIARAKSVLGAPYKTGAEGPNEFDCSGLVYWSFKTGGYGELIGDQRKRAAGYSHWFAAHGHFSRKISTARRGDLIAFSHDGTRISHIGIALGSGRVISALINPYGVSRTRINGLNVKPVGVCLVSYPGQESLTAADHAFGAETANEETVAPSDAPENVVLEATNQ